MTLFMVEKVDEAISDGAECIIGGSLLPEMGPNFYQPTVLRNVATSSRIWATETFGPVVAFLLGKSATTNEESHLKNDGHGQR